MPLTIADLDRMEVAGSPAGGDRAVALRGSAQPHAHLGLATDALSVDRLPVEAAGPLGVVAFSVVAPGMVPSPPAVPDDVGLYGRPLPPVVGHGPVAVPVVEGRRRQVDGL